MSKLTTNQKMVGATVQSLGLRVTDQKLVTDTFLATDIGTAILDNAQMKNMFFSGLVNRIGKLYLSSNQKYENALSVFKKGTLPMGVAIEDIYVNFLPNDDYSQESTLMTDTFRNDDVIAVYYTTNSYKKFYVKTSHEAFTQAFATWDDMDRFINNILSRLYDSQQLYEWSMTKQLIGNDFNQTEGTSVRKLFEYHDNTFSQDLTKMLRSSALNMVCPSSQNNNFQAYAKSKNDTSLSKRPVVTFSKFENLHILIRNENLTDISVDTLSVAFNLKYADFIGQVHGVDNFGITETQTADSKTYNKLYDYEDASGNTHNVYDYTDYTTTESGHTYQYKLIAVICDESYIHIEDTKKAFVDSFNDPSNMILTTYLHSWQTYALCPFSNAYAIYTKTQIS